MSTGGLRLAVLGIFLYLNGFGQAVKVGNPVPTVRTGTLGCCCSPQETDGGTTVAYLRRQYSSPPLSSEEMVRKEDILAEAVWEQFKNNDPTTKSGAGFGLTVDKNGDLNFFSFMFHDKSDVKLGRGFLSSSGKISIQVNLQSILRLNNDDWDSLKDLWDSIFRSGDLVRYLEYVIQSPQNGSTFIIVAYQRSDIEFLFAIAKETDRLACGYYAPNGFEARGARGAASVIKVITKPYENQLPDQEHLYRSFVEFKGKYSGEPINAESVVLEDTHFAKFLPIFNRPSPQNSGSMTTRCFTLYTKDLHFTVVEVPSSAHSFSDVLNLLALYRLPSGENLIEITLEEPGFTVIGKLDPGLNSKIMREAVIRIAMAAGNGTFFFCFITDARQSAAQVVGGDKEFVKPGGSYQSDKVTTMIELRGVAGTQSTLPSTGETSVAQKPTMEMDNGTEVPATQSTLPSTGETSVPQKSTKEKDIGNEAESNDSG